MTTALMRAKIAVATSAFALSALHPGTHTAPPAPLAATASPRTATMAVELAASITSDGSSQTVGVADPYLYNLNQTDLVAQLNEIRSLGVTDLRLVVPWIYIQPTNSTSYNWAQMDNVVTTARSMGFDITASITMNPPWDGTPLVGIPNTNAYSAFAAAVAQRYSNQIGAYEIWNEPNAVTFLAPADPAAYTAMLKAAYTAIKAVEPSATVIAGVLGAVTTVPGLSLSPQQFLAGMYTAGAQGFFDALSFHPYNYTLPFSAGAGVANSPLEQVQQMYALMVANGDAALKIWATEFGNPTSPGGINQTQQAQMLQDFVTAWSKLPFAGPAFVFTANDLNAGQLLDDSNFGLFTSSGIPKLAAQTLATLISQLAHGTLPNYTAPGLSVPQTIWIQVVSTAIAVVNEVLLIPNFVTQIAYNAAPPVLQQAFSAIAQAVSTTAAQTLNAITPAAETGIGMLVNFPTTANAAATALGASVLGTELTVQRALAAIGIGAVPNPAPPAPATATAATAAVTAKPAAETTAAATTPNPATATASTTATAVTGNSEASSTANTTTPATATTATAAAAAAAHPIQPATTAPNSTTASSATASPAPATTASGNAAPGPVAPAPAATPAVAPSKTSPSNAPKTTDTTGTPAPSPTKPATGATKHEPQSTAEATKQAATTSGSAAHTTVKASGNDAHHDGEPPAAGKHSVPAHN